MSMQTPLNKVRGLGAAKEGVAHFWHQRVTAVALIPLSIWFLICAPSALTGDFEAARAWAASPVTAILLILFIATSFYHMKLGLQVVIEDYFSHHAQRLALLALNSFVSYGLAAAAVFAILKVSLGS